MKENTGNPGNTGGKPVRDTKIHGHQYLDEADYQAVLDVLKNGLLHAVPDRGTGGQALQDANRSRDMPYRSATGRPPTYRLSAAGVGKGMVITTPITFAASTNVRQCCTAGPNRYLRISTKNLKSIRQCGKLYHRKTKHKGCGGCGHRTVRGFKDPAEICVEA